MLRATQPRGRPHDRPLLREAKLAVRQRLCAHWRERSFARRGHGAISDHWATFECADCGKRKRVEVPVPDVRARVAAIELLLREGLGRPPQAEEPSVPRLPPSAAAVARKICYTRRSQRKGLAARCLLLAGARAWPAGGP